MNTENIFFNLSVPLLKKLNEGKTIKLGFKIYFWVLGSICILAALFMLYKYFDLMSDWSGGGKFGGFLVTIGFVFALWMSFQIFFFRAKTIDLLHNSQFIVVPIVSIFFRALGEILAAIIVSVGVTMGLASIFSAKGEMADIPGAGAFAEMGFLSIVAAPVIGFIVITLFYLIAESLLAIPQIAINTKRTADKLAPLDQNDVEGENLLDT